MKQAIQVFQYDLPVNLTVLEEGGYLAVCDKLQGCLAEGKTAGEAVANVIDVASNIIEIRKEEKLPIRLKASKKRNGKKSNGIRRLLG